MNTEKGILLIATGHPYYGRMAYNLACTIKAVEDSIPIAVITCGKSLSHLGLHQMDIFDEVIQLPDHAAGGFSPKLYINELTPFQETIYLDVDMLWLQNGKTVSELFNEFTDVEFTGITEGWYDIDTDDASNVNPKYYFWANIDEIKERYSITGRIYQWRSEFIYFKKSENVDKFFDDAQRIHAKPDLKSVKMFGSHVPDELSINISAALNDIHPHKVKYTPAYWFMFSDGHIPSGSSLSEWYLMSFGSNYASGTVKRSYDQVCKVAMSKLGRQHVFSLHSKKDFLVKERLKS